ncbi:hypothetical protein [Catellatospora tritici]|uniref:hypothetical protein n=1 Tax=Catellatospora tritici TaxID=2851566 RepID=UPI0020C4F4DE|nr:hypothetical protein [Catellatospora tritici]
MAVENTLTEAEFLLVRDTAVDQLAGLDEDELLDLHARVRRARNKYTGLYRRQGAAKVSTVGGRGKAGEKNTRNRDKAEVFEDALARVSRRLAVVARESAQALKAERLETARAARNAAPPVAARKPAATPRRSQRTQPTPASAPSARKRHAATRATGARRPRHPLSWVEKGPFHHGKQ